MSHTQPIIDMQNVAKRFGRTQVLDQLDLHVPPGRIYAFLGRNGAGKTTTIRLLLGLIQPDAGSIRVNGHDPTADPLAVRRSVGYLAEDPAMFPWMTPADLLRFLAPFYPTWDAKLATDYLNQFDLPHRTKIKNLSKGQSVRLGLIAALTHRPRLVILDDPALGLDPVMRKEFNRDLITHLQGEGITVFYSSHLLYEVEPVADDVAILHHGRIIRTAATDELRDDVKQLILPAARYEALAARPAAEHILDFKRRDDTLALTVASAADVIAQLSEQGVEPRVHDLSLDDIFEAYVAGHPHDASNPPDPADTHPQPATDPTP